jgi:hypothetical protein
LANPFKYTPPLIEEAGAMAVQSAMILGLQHNIFMGAYDELPIRTGGAEYELVLAKKTFTLP